MKKLLVIFILIFSILTFSSNVYSADNNCNYIEGKSIGQNLDNCLKGSTLVNGEDVSLDAGKGFAMQIKKWTNNVSLYLGVFAVFSIVFGGFMMTLSTGEEEKIKKAKDIIKWGIVGFLGIISASAIINLVVKVMYSI